MSPHCDKNYFYVVFQHFNYPIEVGPAIAHRVQNNCMVQKVQSNVVYHTSENAVI